MTMTTTTAGSACRDHRCRRSVMVLGIENMIARDRSWGAVPLRVVGGRCAGYADVDPTQSRNVDLDARLMARAHVVMIAAPNCAAPQA